MVTLRGEDSAVVTNDLAGSSTQEEIASRYGVVPYIHPEDLIFRFILNHPQCPTRIDAVRSYFSTGHSSAKMLQEILRAHGIVRNFTMLEFASGYGRVTRHLKRFFPECSILASDIHPRAVTFIRKKIGIEAVESQALPQDLGITDLFDVVFVLSFFSHVPDETWGTWLNALAARVEPGGLLLFTTHGGASNLLDRQALEGEGIWFRPQSDQADLPWYDYGTTATSFGYVLNQVSQIRGARLVQYHEGLWFGHQDVYVVRIDKHLPARKPSHDERRPARADEAQLARRLDSAYEDLGRLTAESSRLIGEVEDRDRRLLAAGRDIGRLVGEVQDRDRQLVAAGRDIGGLVGEVQDRDQRLAGADSDLRRLTAEVERLQAIEASLGWRIYRRTQPALSRVRRWTSGWATKG